MAWLRIDDGFMKHSKIAQLSDAQFRVWIRVLCYCATARDPTIDTAAIREISGLDRRRVRTYAALGLLDPVVRDSTDLGSKIDRTYDEVSSEDSATLDPENDPDFDGDFEVHNWAKYMPKEEQNAARQAKWRARRRNAESNARVDTQVTPGPSRARAGTRGVPSRPVEEPSIPPSVAKHAGQNGRTDGDLERITPTDTEPILEQARQP